MSSTNAVKYSQLKNGIFSLFLFILLLPLFQMTLPFLKEERLNGVDLPQPLPTISDSTWFNEDYQKMFALNFEQNIGFHNSLVRLHNQVNYNIFGFSDAGDVVVGKDGYVFLKNYVDAFTGADFVGKEYIDIQSQKIKFIQQELKKKNIDFFIVLAPGKGSFYSEYIPANFKNNITSDNTNYSFYKKLFSEQGVNNLDLNSYFLSIKKTEKYPLYSTTGVHWTEYGCYIAGREIVKYVEKLRNITLPKIKIQSLELASLSGNHSSDYDAASLMNVFSKLPHPTYALPKLKFDSDSKTVKPHFLCISDSYFSGIINTNIPSNVFTDYHYWLYNDGVYPETFLKEKRHDKKQLKQDLEKQDVICLMATDASLAQFPFGFIDEAYEVYAPKNAEYYSLKQKEFRFLILKTIENIKKDNRWKNQLVENAKHKGISEMDEFIANALWIYNQEQLKLKNE